MALVHIFEPREVTDADKVICKDGTQDYIDGTSAGYGQLGNPNRSEVTLLFFAVFIDENSTETYLEQELLLIGSNTKFSIDPGVGYSNTDKSIFQMESSEDGHHVFYMVALEKDSTKVGGVVGDLYYNIDDSLPYYYSGTVWVAITDSLLDTIKDLAIFQTSNQFYRKRARKRVSEARRDVYDPVEGMNVQLLTKIGDYNAKLANAYSAFLSSDYVTARKLLYALNKTRL